MTCWEVSGVELRPHTFPLSPHTATMLRQMTRVWARPPSPHLPPLLLTLSDLTTILLFPAHPHLPAHSIPLPETPSPPHSPWSKPFPTYRLCSIASSSIPVRLEFPFSPRHRFRSQTDLALDPALPLTTCVFGQVTLLCTPPLPRLSHGNKDPHCVGICEDVSHLPPNSY